MKPRALGVLLLLAATVGAGEPAPASAPERVLSGTLLQALDDWATLAIEAVVSSGKPLPAGVTKSDMKDQTIRSFQPLLMVTREEEAKFAKGEFDDEKNLRRFEAQMKALEGLNVSLPMFTTQSIAAFKKGELKGGKLELAVRMNMLPVMKAQELLAKEKEQAKGKGEKQEKE